MSKKYNDEDIIGFCAYCLEEIKGSEDYIIKNKKCYHLHCFGLVYDMPEIDTISEDDEQ